VSTIDRDYEVPYVGGSSWDGKHVYLDRRLPKSFVLKDGRTMRPDKYLKRHEDVEKHLEDQGYSYAYAHEMATKAEREDVEADGYPWQEYQDWALGQVKKLRRLNGEVPKDIDTQPDSDSKDYDMLRSIKKHQESRSSALLRRIMTDEKLMLKDFTSYAKKVSDAYDAAPEHDHSADSSYKSLMDHTEKMFKKIQSRIEVEFVDDEPYQTARAMVDDIEKNKKLLVWKGASDHPVWTPEQNWKFRAVHDYLSHALGVSKGGHLFDLRGELNAFNRHAKTVPPEALGALFTEVVGQVAWAQVHKAFPVQKAALLKGFDYDQLGLVDDAEYDKNFV
jgi:hypothetical protein